MAEEKKEGPAVKGQVEYRPTLVIGCGGTGNEIVRRLKAELTSRYGNTEGVKFLVIDCDTASFGVLQGLPDLNAAEILDITCPDVRSLVRQEPDWLTSWLDVDKVDVSLLERRRGAGGVRAAGRVALFANFDRVRTTLENFGNELAALSDRIAALLKGKSNAAVAREIAIYVVGSLCGGTGAGIFLDVALLARQFIQRQAVLMGVFLLPTAFPDLRKRDLSFYRRLQANAYASIIELSCFMDPTRVEGHYSVQYRSDVRVTIDRELFDEAYLVEGENDDGDELGQKEHAYALVAQWLAQDIASPIGQLARTLAPNIVNDLSSVGVERRVHGFSALGTSSLVAQTDDLLNYCANRVGNRAVEMLNRAALGKPRDEAIGFLDRLGLGTADGWRAKIVCPREDMKWETPVLSPRAVRQPKDQFLRNLETHRTRTLPDAFEQARTIAQANEADLLSQVKDDLRRRLDEIVYQHGVRSAAQFLENLLPPLEKIVSVIGEQVRAWESGPQTGEAVTGEQQRASRGQLNDRLDREMERLRKYGSITDLVFRPHLDETLKDGLIRAINSLAQREMSFMADEAALRAVNDFREEVERLRSSANEAGNRLGQADEHMDKEAEGILGRLTLLEGRYAMKISVCDRDYFEWFLANRVSVQPGDIVSSARPSEGWIQYLASHRVEDIMEHFASAGRGVVEDRVREVTLLHVLQDMAAARGRNFDRYVRRLVAAGLMSDKCWLPLTTTFNPPQQHTIGLPIPLSEEELTAEHEWLRDQFGAWLQDVLQAGDQPQKLAVQSRNTIDFARRKHGILAQEIKNIDDWRECYRLLDRPELPLHVDKRFPLTSMVDPLAVAEMEEYPLFALAIAYGFAARVGATDDWYFGAEKAPEGHLRPKYSSTWPTVQQLSKGKRGPQPLGITKGQSQDSMGKTRSEALRSFLESRDWPKQIREWSDEYVHEVTPNGFISEVLEYVSRCLDARLKPLTPDTDVYEELMTERQALAKYLTDLDPSVQMPEIRVRRAASRASRSPRKKSK